MDITNLLSRCDHTLLRQDATRNEIKTLCEEGIEFSVASVCIPPSHIAYAKSIVKNSLKICTVIGFPNGYSTSLVKAYEAENAIFLGAGEVDMVINISMLKDRCYTEVLNDIKQVRASSQGHILKVIIETCLLTDEEKKEACKLVSDSGADYIKTSTGFSTGGATRDDIILLRKFSAAHVKVKASGGIASLNDAEEFISLGADRLGTSKIVKLVSELMRRTQ